VPSVTRFAFRPLLALLAFGSSASSALGGDDGQQSRGPAVTGSAAPEQIEQTQQGQRPPAQLVASFDGLGQSFVGPQGRSLQRNPSDNSLAVGPNHIVQTVNTRMAIFTKKGQLFGEDGRPLYGPVETRNVFRGFGGPCEEINNGDAVVRYDQLADRWLIVMPIFRRLPKRLNEPPRPRAGDPARYSMVGRPAQPGPAAPLFQPAALPPEHQLLIPPRMTSDPSAQGSFAMCYAVSATPDPLGSYYRYEFVRPLFPDYPRPAIWNDGYYVPSSTGDEVIEKHACVVERAKMLAGRPAREQCIIVEEVNFLNNADVDGRALPPAGAANIMIAAGGAQLRGRTGDNGLYVWKFHVNWDNPARTRLIGPAKIPVAPYEYLCGGQLTKCVPQRGEEVRLDSQGDKIMSRFVYRRLGEIETMVAVHSIATSSGGGGVRWYELRLNKTRDVVLHQQGTYAPGGNYRWLPSPAIDGAGNIGIGYSFGGNDHFPGQRFAARMAGDPPGQLTLQENVLAEGQAPQSNSLRWEDYTQTALDPVDDCTIWYTGDYVRAGDAHYSTRIGAFLLPGCRRADQ
jgi:hypothetical protein